MDISSTNSGLAGASRQQRLRALERANHVRIARAALKRRLRAGEVAVAEAILSGSRDTDTMTVADLLLSQRGWGPRRCSKMLRSISLSEKKTLGSLTERQRVMLAAVLSGLRYQGQLTSLRPAQVDQHSGGAHTENKTPTSRTR